jgi:prolyl-tRNA editing enzyme YbaK/EbsC (Cys-tRNA(Pro) deacylase)
LAARAAGVDVGQIAKSILFLIGEKLVVKQKNTLAPVITLGLMHYQF